MGAPADQRRYAEESFWDLLSQRMRERRHSLRWLASRAGVDHGYLSRAQRGVDGKTLSPDLKARLAALVGLPAESCPELRQHEVIRRIQADATLRDRVYHQISATPSLAVDTREASSATGARPQEQ